MKIIVEIYPINFEIFFLKLSAMFFFNLCEWCNLEKAKPNEFETFAAIQTAI